MARQLCAAAGRDVFLRAVQCQSRVRRHTSVGNRIPRVTPGTLGGKCSPKSDGLHPSSAWSSGEGVFGRAA
eukprot:2847940-Alexandrium_andersonii.AAC.1